jgi:membrane-associated HD superfamily phosphohydrolase
VEVLQEPKVKRTYKKRQEIVIEEEVSDSNDILEGENDEVTIFTGEDVKNVTVSEVNVEKIQIKPSVVKYEIKDDNDNEIDNLWKQVYVPFNFLQKFGWLVVAFYCLLSHYLPKEFKLPVYDFMESIILITQIYVIVGTILLSTFVFSFLPFIFLSNKIYPRNEWKEGSKVKIYFLAFISFSTFHYFQNK